MTDHQRRTLVWCGLAALLSALDGSVLFLALPAIGTEFHAKLPSLANLGSVVALGAVGALPLGLLADRRGRRLLIAAGTAGFGLADLASAVAPNLGWLAALRVVAVVFETAVAEAALILVVEAMPASHRGLGSGAIAVAGGLGAGIATVAYPLVAPHWRLLYLVGAVALPVALLTWRRLPESEVWEQARSLPALAWRGPWVRRLVLVAAAALLGAVLFEPAGLLLPFFASRELHLGPAAISAVVLGASLLGGVTYVVGGVLTDRLGRRRLGVALALASSLAGGAAFVGGAGLFVGGNLAFGALASAVAPVFSAWFAELFPTRVRVTAEMLDVVAGALGGVAGLQLATLLAAHVGLGHAIALETLVAVPGALILVLLPETGGHELDG
ncbi:MAG TPA: MFS transporter [Candidatus Dormibacteraeota bacterium]